MLRIIQQIKYDRLELQCNFKLNKFLTIRLISIFLYLPKTKHTLNLRISDRAIIWSLDALLTCDQCSVTMHDTTILCHCTIQKIKMHKNADMT